MKGRRELLLLVPIRMADSVLEAKDGPSQNVVSTSP